MRSLLLLCLLAAPARADSNTEIHLGGDAGGGRVELMGETYSSMNLGVDLTARHWLSPNLGIGARLGFVAAVPFANAMAPDGRAMSREVPWLVEPELVVRTTPTGHRVELGALAGIGLGPAWLRTVEPCSLDLSIHESCQRTIEKRTAAAGSLFAGGTLAAYHVTGFVGARASANDGGDRDLALVADVGATF